MEQHKTINLFDIEFTQLSKFRIKNQVEINGDARGTYYTKGHNLTLFNYSDAYILVKATITVVGDRDDTTARHEEERNIQVHYKNCAPFTDCMSEKNNKQVDNTKDLRVAVPMYDLREYSNNYFTKSGSL